MKENANNNYSITDIYGDNLKLMEHIVFYRAKLARLAQEHKILKQRHKDDLARMEELRSKTGNVCRVLQRSTDINSSFKVQVSERESRINILTLELKSRIEEIHSLETVVNNLRKQLEEQKQVSSGYAANASESRQLLEEKEERAQKLSIALEESDSRNKALSEEKMESDRTIKILQEEQRSTMERLQQMEADLSREREHHKLIHQQMQDKLDEKRAQLEELKIEGAKERRLLVEDIARERASDLKLREKTLHEEYVQQLNIELKRYKEENECANDRLKQDLLSGLERGQRMKEDSIIKGVEKAFLKAIDHDSIKETGELIAALQKEVQSLTAQQQQIKNEITSTLNKDLETFQDTIVAALRRKAKSDDAKKRAANKKSSPSRQVSLEIEVSLDKCSNGVNSQLEYQENNQSLLSLQSDHPPTSS